MRRKLRGLLLGIILLNGCGTDKALPPVGFVNQTQHSDAQLWTLWHAAQQDLSRQIDLNPLQRVLNHTPPQVLPGDTRVWNISPHLLQVSWRADVSSAAFFASTGIERADPTGLIDCPQPCNVHYAPAYSLYAQPTSRYAASWESSESNFDFLVQYEFENQILNALGYNVQWR
jgi:hypothetical protein